MKHAWWYAAAMTVVGLAVGYFVALSRSPVVAVLLPLLFSLIAGVSGIYVAREDLTQVAGRKRLGFLGICILAFVCGSLVSSGTLLILKRPQLTPSLTEISGFDKLTPEERIYLVQLRALTLLLGTSQEERVGILEAASRKVVVPADEPSVVSRKLREFLEPISNAETALAEDLVAGFTDDSLKQQAMAVKALLRASKYLFDHWSNSIESEATSAVVIQQQINLLRESLGELVGTTNSLPTTNLQILSQAPEVLGVLLELRAMLETGAPKLTETVENQLSGGGFEFRSERLEIIKLLAGVPMSDRSSLRDQIGEFAINFPDRGRLTM
jgi:hypothetical protein